MHNRTRKTARRSRIEVRPTTLLRPQALDSLLAFGLGRVHRTPCLANDNVAADDVNGNLLLRPSVNTRRTQQ